MENNENILKERAQNKINENLLCKLNNI